MSKIRWEYDVVERPFCLQLQQMGWQWIEGDPDLPETTERTTSREVLLKARLSAALKKINLRDGKPWLDDGRVAGAIRDLEQAAGHRLMDINESATELLLKGTVTDGLADWDFGRPQPVKFIDFENPANNDFLVINQFKVELTSGRGHVIPDAVLFVNGIPIGVAEFKSPAIQNPIQEAINQLLRYPLLLQFASVDSLQEAGRTLAVGLRSLQTGADQPASAASPKSSPPGRQQLQEEGLSLLDLIWKTAEIPVCWENPTSNFQSEMSLVRKEVADTWERECRLRFTGWQKCAPENRGLRIQIDDSSTSPHTAGLGRQLDGVPNGIVINFTFTNWSPSCQSTRDYCIRATAGHLFGHAIGFGHTQNLPDAPEDCRQRMGQGEVVSWQLTPYDPDSIMNYCNSKFYNDGNLSELDIKALRILYGSPVK